MKFPIPNTNTKLIINALQIGGRFNAVNVLLYAGAVT